jgi:hypothetical protein
MRLMPRDLEALRKLAAARWLTTEQLHALFFGALSSEMVRRRLRLLRKTGYLQTRQDHRMAQSLHALTAEGRRLVMAHGWEGKIKPERTLPKHLEHLLGVNHIRVAVELGAKAAGWQLSFFTGNWKRAAGRIRRSPMPRANSSLTDRQR